MERRAVHHNYICNMLLNDNMRHVLAFIEGQNQALQNTYRRMFVYSHALHNDIMVNDGLHI